MNQQQAPADSVAQERANAALRMAAAHVYVSSPKSVRPQDLCDLAAFAHLTSAELTKWAQQDGWQRRRQEHEEAARRTLHKQLADEVLHQHHRHLEELEAISREAKVMAGMAKPRSWEAVQQVHLRCLELKHQWQSDMLEHSRDQQPQEVVQHPLPKDSVFHRLDGQQWQNLSRFLTTFMGAQHEDPGLQELLAETSTDQDTPA